jgi:modulator of FtsH protease
MGGWHDFFVAQVGASAALVGLLFVALSINVSQILKFAWLPIRGGLTLVGLTGALIEGSLALLPGAGSGPIAVVSLLAAATTWLCSLALVVLYLRALYKQTKVRVPASWSYGFAAAVQIATLPAIVGSAVVLSGRIDGYYWLAAGVLISLVLALYNAWILLIEILR